MMPLMGLIRGSGISFSAKWYAVLGTVLKYFVSEVR